MAKSKMSLQVHMAFLNLKASSNSLKQHLEKKQPVPHDVMEKYYKDCDNLNNATYNLKIYLDKLAVREKSSTVADKLRNLKNVFKNKEELTQKRQNTRIWYDELSKKIMKLKADNAKVLSGNNPAQSMATLKASISQITQWEVQVASHDPIVDAVEMALV